MYTAEQLSKFSSIEIQKIVDSMPKLQRPNKETLDKLNVGVYDKDGHLTDEKEGDEY